MRNLKFIFVAFIIVELACSWSIPKGNTQDTYSQDEQNKTILKQAVVGAGVGAVSSGASGGSAGKGALIGAGTNVIGNALVNTLTSAPQPQVQQQPQPQIQYVPVPERGVAAQIDPPRDRGCGRSR